MPREPIEALDLTRPAPPIPERELPLVLSDREFIEQSLQDPTFPHPEGRRPGGKPLLDKDQQRMLAVWIVEGLTRAQMQKMADDLGWKIELGKHLVSYYRTKRLDLMVWASEFVTSLYAHGGLKERVLRVQAVVEHAEYLKALIDDGRLLEAEMHTVQMGKETRNVTSQKFSQHLSKQYLDALALIDKMNAPIEERMERARQKHGVSAVPQDAQDRFIEMAGWNADPYAALPAGRPEPAEPGFDQDLPALTPPALDL